MSSKIINLLSTFRVRLHQTVIGLFCPHQTQRRAESRCIQNSELGQAWINKKLSFDMTVVRSKHLPPSNRFYATELERPTNQEIAGNPISTGELCVRDVKLMRIYLLRRVGKKVTKAFSRNSQRRHLHNSLAMRHHISK